MLCCRGAYEGRGAAMLALKYLLILVGALLFGSAGVLVAYDIYLSEQLRRLLSGNKPDAASAEPGALTRRAARPVRWRLSLQLIGAGTLALLLAQSFIVIPDGAAGVRVSELWGVRPGTLYPGLHLVTPLVDSVAIYDTREQVYSTEASENAQQSENARQSENAKATDSDKSREESVRGAHDAVAGEVLTVQAREGLNIGLAVSVRYRLDPKQLEAIHRNLPRPVGQQVVGP